MLKLVSDMLEADKQLYQDVVKACKEAPDSQSWFCTKTFNELKRVTEFCNAHSWEIDITRIQHKFTAFECMMIESLMKSNNAKALESRERMCRTAAQKTTRHSRLTPYQSY